jgi:hypothetical protein
MTQYFIRGSIALASLLSACSSTSQSKSVEDVLDAFGVDHAATPRLDDDLAPLPPDFTPLGGRTTIDRFEEVVLFGIGLDDPRLGTTGVMPVVDLIPGANNTLTPSLLAEPAAPWLAGSIPRAAARGDFDRDGVDEIAVVYREPNEPIRLVVLDGASVAGPFVVGLAAVTELFVTSGDFDGDLTDDLLVAQVRPSAVDLRLIRNLPSGWAADPTGPSLPTTAADVGVVLAAGNLDRDRGLEIAVVVNEQASTASARRAIYDDAATGFAVLASGPVTVTTATEVVTVRAAGVALGDVDGDGVDEVVIGGLTAIGNTCNLTTSYAVEVLDDGRTGLARLAANIRPWLDTRQPCSSGSQHRMETLHVLTADLDGDGASEIVTNEYIYDDLRATPGELLELYQLPQSELLTLGTSGSNYRFSWRTTAFAAGDVTSDRRDDLVFYTQRDSAQVVQVWSDDQIDGWSKTTELRTRFTNGYTTVLRPQIVLADADLDASSMAIEYSEGSYRQIFTEPVLIAALAAAPCFARDQDVDGACRTAFGKAVSETNTRTDSWSFITGVSVGYETEFSVLGVKTGGAEAIVNTRNTLRGYTSKAYTQTTSVLRETGPIEDSVIFATVPLDVFTYTILSHPNPELVGGKIEIRLPRSPITILAQREFYNAHILPDAFHVDASVFAHSAGDPKSYRRASSKTALLREFTGVESDQVDVGQGSGRTLVSISKLDTTSTGLAFDFEATLDLRGTSGVVVGGFSIGGGAGFDLSITRGTEMMYQGSVANLAADHFPKDAYRFGLFTYIHDDPAVTSQKFEVVDYWVEPF